MDMASTTTHKQGIKRLRTHSDESNGFLTSVKQSEPYRKKSSDIISSSYKDFASLWEVLADEEDHKLENSWLSPDQEKVLSDLMASLEKEIGDVSQSQSLSSSVQNISKSDTFNTDCFSLCTDNDPSLGAYTSVGIDFDTVTCIEDGVLPNIGMHAGTIYCTNGENLNCSFCTSMDDYMYGDWTMHVPPPDLPATPDLQTESRAEAGWMAKVL